MNRIKATLLSLRPLQEATHNGAKRCTEFEVGTAFEFVEVGTAFEFVEPKALCGNLRTSTTNKVLARFVRKVRNHYKVRRYIGCG